MVGLLRMLIADKLSGDGQTVKVLNYSLPIIIPGLSLLMHLYANSAYVVH